MRTAAASSRPPVSRAAGFTLVELLVTVLVVAEILIVAGLLFDFHNKTARAQNQVAETQQSLRVAQREMISTLRMAGRGGVPANLPPIMDPLERILDGLALQVDDNVPLGTQIVAGEARTNVVENTDVVRVRGVFATPYYQLLSSALGERNLRLTGPPGSDDNPSIATGGQVDVFSPSPSGFAQDLGPLLAAPAGSALLLISPLSDQIYAVVEITGVVAIDDPPPPAVQGVTISFQITGGDHGAQYGALFQGGPSLPNNLNSAAFAGLLEEHVFYVRETYTIPGDPTSDLMPKLARVRVHPRTQEAIDGLGEDVADNVVDLQVALGYNSPGGPGGYFDRGQLADLLIEETADGAGDDWLLNAAADDPENAPWAGPWGTSAGDPPQPELYYVRITTLARTEGREFQYISPPIARIENRVYDEEREPAVHDPERMYHRRMLRTVIDLRNL